MSVISGNIQVVDSRFCPKFPEMEMDQRLERVDRFVARGVTLREALSRLNLSSSTYYKLRKRLGLETKRERTSRPSVYTEKTIQRVQRELAKGRFLKDICAGMGIDSRNLTRACRLRGMKLFSPELTLLNYEKRKGVARKRRSPHNTGSRRPQIESMLLRGWKVDTVQRRLGLSASYIRTVRKQLVEEGRLPAKEKR